MAVRSIRTAALVGLLCLVLRAPARAFDESSFERARAEAAGAFVAELLSLAHWCEGKKLNASRELCLRDVLRFEPDQAEARAGLGHRRGPDGWIEPERRRPLGDHDRTAQVEYRERRARAFEPFRDALLAALERERAGLPAERVDALREELLALAPDDERVRAAFGERRSGESWVLAETLVARERRAALKALVREAYEQLPEPLELQASAEELALGLDFTQVLGTPVARILATGSKEEALALARALQATRACFSRALGKEASYYSGARVFVLARPGEKERFLERYPGLEGPYREFLATLQGSGIQGSHDMAHWGKEEALRLDGLVRIALGWLLYDAFHLTSDTAWVYEGLGLYLTRELVGTRLTWFVKPSEYLRPREEQELRARLLKPGTNWMDEASKVLAKEHRPRLAFVMGKRVDNMSPEDMLYAYVMAAYLLEALPEKAPLLLARIGAGTSSQVAVQEVLGLDVRQLDERVRRWLGERR